MPILTLSPLRREQMVVQGLLSFTAAVTLVVKNVVEKDVTLATVVGGLVGNVPVMSTVSFEDMHVRGGSAPPPGPRSCRMESRQWCRAPPNLCRESHPQANQTGGTATS
jgi:uncharacterized protein (UPF0210 family)